MSTWRVTLLLAVISTFSFWLGCSEAPPKEDPKNTNNGTDKSALTYYKDIKPLLDKNCVSCHTKGCIGPFHLNDYKEVYKIRHLIANEVKSKRMPPWHAGEKCQDYLDNPSMSELEIKKIVDWVGTGGTEGKLADYTKPDNGHLKPKSSGLSRVDLTLKPKVAYKGYKKPDDHRCFVMDWPLKEKTFVTGVQINPDNLNVVHHVIVVAIPPSQVQKLEKLEAEDEKPGYVCYGSPGRGLTTKSLGAWVPGAKQRDMPKGAGVTIEPGSKIIVQMHYNVTSGDAGPDQTSVSFKVDDKIEREMLSYPVVNPLWIAAKTMNIPAGKSDVKHSHVIDTAKGFAGRFTIPEGKTATVYAATLHLHTRGKSARLWVERKGGGNACLLNIPRWDFNWQGRYYFKKPLELKSGDKVGIECHWDNTAKNQPTIDGKKITPRELNWGDGTHDEMCLGAFFYTLK